MLKFALTLILSLVGKHASAVDFLPRYEDSRSRFRMACSSESRTVFCKHYNISSRVDRDLTIDIGLFGGMGNRLIILQSGIHGPETPAGAAVQELFMEKYLRTFVDKDFDVLLVHAVNPYGFKFGRRVNEDNVDLNRNFTLDRGLYHYGGAAPAEQVRIFSDLYLEMFSKYEEILMLDIHTGLGDKGVLHIIPSGDLEARFSRVQSEGVRIINVAGDKKFYAPKGDVIDFVRELAPKNVCANALTLEFGTMGSSLVTELDTVTRIILENQAHFHGCTSAAVCTEVKRAFVDLFNPNERGWQNAVLSRANRLFEALSH